MIDLSPSGIAQAKRDRIAATSEQAYQLWRHDPITAGYLQYLEDQIVFMRDAAADLLESGLFKAGDQHQDRNPDSLRGQIIMLRQLHTLELRQIKEFYGVSEPDDEAKEAGANE